MTMHLTGFDRSRSSRRDQNSTQWRFSIHADFAVISVLLLAAVCVVLVPASVQAAPKDRPNILLMMVDDLGFSDFGCYGGEIETPTIDGLADSGMRFSQFYNTAKCHSSRVSLLTGLYCNQAGNTKLSRGVTIAEVLGGAGYATSMTGKWHLKGQPTERGFDHYWGHLSGATDCFVGDKSFRLDGEEWDNFDEDFYTTDANVDYAIRFIDEALDSGRPFFHYIAFNAPHYPLQAPRKDIEKYVGRYDGGWDETRRKRFAKQKDLGLFPEEMKLPPLPGHIPAWNDLEEKAREFESYRMAIFAAMVDRIDQNLARLFAFLKQRKQFDNTLIMLLSDNGACPFERSKRLDIPPWKGESFYLYDASWATVGNTPLKHYKQTQHEGGISTPFIIHWPGQVKEGGSWNRNPGHLVDVMATCIEAAGASYPADENVEPLQGKSLLPLVRGGAREGHDCLYFQFSSCRALRQGDWKAVSFYSHKWELYNIAEDRTEQNDLAERYPERLADLVKRWHTVAETVDRAPKGKRKPVKDQPSPGQKSSWHKDDVYKSWSLPESE